MTGKGRIQIDDTPEMSGAKEYNRDGWMEMDRDEWIL